MKKCILLLLLFTYLGYSQNDEKKVDDLIQKFSEELIGDDIDLFFYNKRYCIGETVIFRKGDDTVCFSNGTYYEVYFFWKDNDKAMLKKLDNCGGFKALEIDDDRVYRIFADNLEQLGKEEVKKYMVEQPENVPVQRTDVYPCYREYYFINGDETFKKKFSLFDLTNESKYENIYYEHNRGLLIVDLDTVIAELIKESDSKFKREKNK